VLNRLSDLRDPSRSAADWRGLLPCGETLRLKLERLREAVWPRSCGWRISSDRRWQRLRDGFRRVDSCSYHWTRVVTLTRVKFWPLHDGKYIGNIVPLN